MAVGIVMRDQNVDEDQAFAYLRRTSQDSNRKLRDVAEDVIRDRWLPPDTRRAERLHS
jgi:AmiR/NasT family two-component response regulator